MPAQFWNIATWGVEAPRYTAKSKSKKRTWNASQIAAEAERDHIASLHVLNPKAPDILFGIMPKEVVAEAKERVDMAKDSVGRRAKRTTKVMLTAVASFPDALQTMTEEAKKKALEWEKRVVDHAKKMWGENLRSVVRHIDEMRWHLHVIVLAPVRGDRVAMDEVHPGWAALNVARETGQGKRGQDLAMRNALQGMQDAYYEDVSVHFGHTRIGPKRLRYTRAEYNARKAETERLASVAQRLEQRERELDGTDIGALTRALEEAMIVQRAENRARLAAEAEVKRLRAEVDKNREDLALLHEARREAALLEKRATFKCHSKEEEKARLRDIMRRMTRESA